MRIVLVARLLKVVDVGFVNDAAQNGERQRWVKLLIRHKTLAENCGTRSASHFSPDLALPFLAYFIGLKTGNRILELVAASTAHPKSSHDVDAMPAGISGYPIVSLRFLLGAGTLEPGQK